MSLVGQTSVHVSVHCGTVTYFMANESFLEELFLTESIYDGYSCFQHALYVEEHSPVNKPTEHALQRKPTL